MKARLRQNRRTQNPGRRERDKRWTAKETQEVSKREGEI